MLQEHKSGLTLVVVSFMDNQNLFFFNLKSYKLSKIISVDVHVLEILKLYTFLKMK